MSVDAQARIDALRARLGLKFPMVSDPTLGIATSYGVRQSGEDLALPATFVLDADGKIAFVHVAKNPVDRLATKELLRRLGS